MTTVSQSVSHLACLDRRVQSRGMVVYRGASHKKKYIFIIYLTIYLTCSFWFFGGFEKSLMVRRFTALLPPQVCATWRFLFCPLKMTFPKGPFPQKNYPPYISNPSMFLAETKNFLWRQSVISQSVSQLAWIDEFRDVEWLFVEMDPIKKLHIYYLFN